MKTIEELSELLPTDDYYVRVAPTDILMYHCEDIDSLLSRMPEKYRKNLIGFDVNCYKRVWPIFTPDVQAMWDEEIEQTNKSVMSFCDENGCG